MMKNVLILVGLLGSTTTAFAVNDPCNLFDNIAALEKLDRKVIHQLSKLYSAKTIAEGNGILRTKRSVNKLTSVAGRRHEIKKEFQPLSQKIKNCVEASFYSFAERDAVEAQLDVTSTDVEKLESDYKSIRDIVIDNAGSRK